MEVTGTDGQAKEGRVVLKVLAVETDLLSITSRLENPRGRNLHSSGGLVMDYPAAGTNSSTDLLMTLGLNRGHASVSDPVSKKGRNREPLQKLSF